MRTYMWMIGKCVGSGLTPCHANPSIHPYSECSRLIDLIAHLTFCSVQGCIQVGRSVKDLIGGGDERAPRC